MAAVGTVDELIDTARTRTGLDDFGSDSFLEGLTGEFPREVMPRLPPTPGDLLQ